MNPQLSKRTTLFVSCNRLNDLNGAQRLNGWNGWNKCLGSGPLRARRVIPIATLLPPLTMPDYEARISAVPALGKRTELILGELGYSRGDIATLREADVV